VVAPAYQGFGLNTIDLFYMRRFAALWPDADKVPSAMAQIPWTAHRTLLDGFARDQALYIWYASKAAEGRWSVRHLQAQISLELHRRAGAAVTNFAAVLESPDAERALQATKDPYIFDFLELAEDVRERDLEQALIDDIQKFLLELGSGFAFYGRQKALLVGEEEFFLDLLFYHHPLRRFVVIELKAEVPAGVRLEDELLPERSRRAAAAWRRSRERRDHSLRWRRRHGCQARAPLRVCADRGFDVERGAPRPELPAVEITDDVPADLGELAELDEVRTRLIERVARHNPQMVDDSD
jgi:predicted nuclease of restriction endonuclease-like (RecB) superfamily